MLIIGLMVKKNQIYVVKVPYKKNKHNYLEVIFIDIINKYNLINEDKKVNEDKKINEINIKNENTDILEKKSINEEDEINEDKEDSEINENIKTIEDFQLLYKRNIFELKQNLLKKKRKRRRLKYITKRK